MKKQYSVPELELVKFTLTRDILGDSRPEETDNPIIPDPPIDDPWGL